MGIMNYKYVKIDSNNISNYTDIWLDVIQMIGRGINFDRALQMIKENKASFLSVEQMYKTSDRRLDFYYVLRVLELDDKPIAFLNGIVRYFDEGVFFQIGSYGTVRRFQKHGHGAAFWRYIENELREKGINLAWGIIRNQGFWEKQGFVADENQFLSNYYDISPFDPIYYKRISEKKNTMEDFMHIFDGDYGIDNNERLRFIRNPIGH